MVFWLSEKIVGALKYFCLYRFALCMSNDPVQTTLVIHRCSEVNWSNTASENGSVSYVFESGKIPESKKMLCRLVKALVV